MTRTAKTYALKPLLNTHVNVANTGVVQQTVLLKERKINDMRRRRDWLQQSSTMRGDDGNQLQFDGIFTLVTVGRRMLIDEKASDLLDGHDDIVRIDSMGEGVVSGVEVEKYKSAIRRKTLE